MNDTKAELVEVVLKGQGGERDIARTTKHLTPMISMMVQMVEGKEDEVPVFARRLAERIVPVVRDVAREMYIERFSLEQLEALAGFHRDNPWYHELSAQMNEALNVVVQERAGPLMKELFDEYLPDPEEEEKAA